MSYNRGMYTEKIQALKLEIGELQQQLASGTGPSGALQARLASAQRQLRWYLRRQPRRIEALGVHTSETITLADRT